MIIITRILEKNLTCIFYQCQRLLFKPKQKLKFRMLIFFRKTSSWHNTILLPLFYIKLNLVTINQNRATTATTNNKDKTKHNNILFAIFIYIYILMLAIMTLDWFKCQSLSHSIYIKCNIYNFF